MESSCQKSDFLFLGILTSKVKTGFKGKRNSKRFHQKIPSKDDNKWASIKFCKEKKDYIL